MITTYCTATTLDGYLADPDDSLDWLFVQDIDEDGPMNHASFMAGIGALVMGATTYEWVRERVEEWPYQLPSWVFTHRDLPVPDGDVRLVAGTVEEHWDAIAASAGERDLWMVGGGGLAADAIAASAGERDLWMVGGGGLAAQFAEAGHLDEVVVSIAPVTLGAGRPLFPRPYRLELLELARNRAFACARYRVLGAPVGGWE